ncbi:MAG: phytanoyl-CoA dioxygenase [Halobacteriovoraceae bacterium]|jgi:hypothetical protein|nr:phytanoyl-CoA dioxygenase [Halobacteriovoraceae bacterium]
MSADDMHSPGLLDRLVSKVKYFDRYLIKGKNAPAEGALPSSNKELCETLSKQGYVILKSFIPQEKLDYLVKGQQERLENLEFSMPEIAQKLIDPSKDQDLIDNVFFEGKKQLIARGLTFDRGDVTSLEQAVEDFGPSTLKCFIPPKDKAYFDLWLMPEILSLVEEYLGLRPYLLEAYTRRNYPAPFKVMNHCWHRDTNHDFHLVKVFFFLSDCELDTGPHEYVANSHRDFSLSGQRYYSSEQVDQWSSEKGHEKVLSVVPAGTVVIEDTRGLHRANIPKSKYRDLGYAVFSPVMLQNRKKMDYYQVSPEVYAKLSPMQKSYIPNLNWNS